MSPNSETSGNFRLHQAIWAFFRSLRLTIALFIAIGIVLVAGTFLPQGAQSLFLAESDPSLYHALKPFGIFDIYHSSLFSLLSLLLGINLLVCTIDRLPLVIRRFADRDPSLSDATFSSARLSRTLCPDPGHSLDSLAGRAGAAMEEAFGSFKTLSGGGRTVLWHDSGRYSRLAVLAVHTGVIVILAGAIVTARFGYEGAVTIPEGGVSDTIRIENQSGEESERTLPFSIRCDSFTYERFADGSPKSYRSMLTILENGNAVKSAGIAVNSPMKHAGLGIYQSYFHEDEQKTQVEIGFSSKDGSKEASAAGTAGSELKTDKSWVTGEYRLGGYMPDFEGFGPAVKIEYRPSEGEPQSFLLFQRHPGFDVKNRRPDVVLSISGIKPAYATGLQISYDPGAGLVFAGAMLLLLGLFVSLAVPHAQAWISVTPMELRAAATSSKRSASVEKRFETLLKEIERSGACKP